MALYHFFLFFSLLILVNAKSIKQNKPTPRPVFIIHGILAKSGSMDGFSKRIQEMHPGTIVKFTDKYNNWNSLTKMWKQVEDIGQDVLDFGRKYSDGINLIGYSQGGLIARAILQRFPKHNVKTFISLSAPQAGQYGDQFIHKYFPALLLKYAYKIFYTKAGQDTSAGNYWNDPNEQELYYKVSEFLPYINNEKPHDKDYKTGLTKLHRLVLIGSPDDGVIGPWQSSHFGFFDSKMNVIEMREGKLYNDDLIGLRTLDKEGKIKTITVANVNHYMWHKDESIIDKYILPHLD